jgi:uncharacterized membrane protein
MDYVTLKWLHVLSSTLLFGTGLGSAFYMYFASRTRDARVVATVVRYVVIADFAFTTTTVVFQPVSGFWLAHLAGFPLGSRWIVWSTALYVLAGVCWLPVVWMQIRMRDLAQAAAARDEPLPAAYWSYLRVWTILGMPAFVALVLVFWLMIAKPA